MRGQKSEARKVIGSLKNVFTFTFKSFSRRSYPERLTNHIKHLQSKIKSRVGLLFRNKASFTLAAKLTLVKLTTLPILYFGDVIYKIASNTLLNKLDAVYHSAICFVTNAP